MPLASSPRYFHRQRTRWAAWFALLLGVAVLLRAGVYGDPLFYDDEPFYWLVGGRVLHGARLYVDVWDRKPAGLFALFAALRLLGTGVIVSQLAATLSAALTATMVMALAARRAVVIPSVMAGLFYLVMAGALGGITAQAPVFYNPLIALAAWLILQTCPPLDSRGELQRACLAMLLCGLAIQLKPNAAFEGAAFGLWLLVRMRGLEPRVIAARAMLFAGLGLAPTVLVAGWFWASGEGAIWWFANVQSQLLKTGGWNAEALWRLGDLALQSLPLLIAAGVGLWRGRKDERWLLLAMWTGAALADGVAIGNFWTHYALPLTLVASILSAELWSIGRVGPILFVLVFAPFAISQSTRYWPGAANARRTVATMLRVIPRDVRTHCMFGYETPPAYYDLTDACLVTPYVFIDQLRSQAEAHALPVEASVALRQALARRPGVILTVVHSAWKLRNRENDAILGQTLARDYRRIAIVAQRRWPSDPESVAVWRRDDLP